MTWELTNLTYNQLTHIHYRCGGTMSIEKIDKNTHNITVPTEMDDVVVEYCEENNIPCRLI